MPPSSSSVNSVHIKIKGITTFKNSSVQQTHVLIHALSFFMQGRWRLAHFILFHFIFRNCVSSFVTHYHIKEIWHIYNSPEQNARAPLSLG